MEGVKTKPKTRRATRNRPAAGKARGPKRPAANRRKRKAPRPEPAPPPGPGRAVPDPKRLRLGGSLPDDPAEAVAQVLAPAHRQLVLEVQGHVGRAVGITLAHLMWLDPLAASPG